MTEFEEKMLQHLAAIEVFLGISMVALLAVVLLLAAITSNTSEVSP